MPPKKEKPSSGKTGKQVKKVVKEEKLKPWEEQNETEKQATLLKAREQLTELGLTGIELIVSKETHYPSKQVNDILAIAGSVAAKNEKKLEKFAKVFHDVASKFDVAVTSFGVGDKAPDAEVYDFDEEKLDLFDEKECQVIVLLFWAPWVPGYQDALRKLYELAEKHGEEWKGKASFVSVAIDGSVETAKQELAKLHLDSPHVSVYWGGDDEAEGDEADDDGAGVVSQYDIQHLPDLLIINSVGNLVKRGDPSDLGIERAVAKLVHGDNPTDEDFEVPKKEKKGAWSDMPEKQRDDIVAAGSSLLSKSKDLEGALLVTSDTRIIHLNGNEKMERTLLLLGKIEQKHEGELLEVVRLIESQGVSDLTKLVMVSSAPADIKPAERCSNCTKPFGAQAVPVKKPSNKGSKKKGSKKGSKKKGSKPAVAVASEPVSGTKWHCAICVQPYTLCDECETIRLKSHGAIHPEYHIMYRVPEGFAESALGTVEFGIGAFSVMMGKEGPVSETEEIVHDQVFCNGCDEGKGHIAGQDRYKCCHCADFDFCARCYNEYAQGTKEHDKDHLFVKITDSEFVTIAGDDDEGDEMDDIDPEDYEKVMEALKSHSLQDGVIDGEKPDENGNPKIQLMDDEDEEEEEAPKPTKGTKPKETAKPAAPASSSKKQPAAASKDSNKAGKKEDPKPKETAPAAKKAETVKAEPKKTEPKKAAGSDSKKTSAPPAKVEPPKKGSEKGPEKKGSEKAPEKKAAPAGGKKPAAKGKGKIDQAVSTPLPDD